MMNKNLNCSNIRIFAMRKNEPEFENCSNIQVGFF